MMAARTQERATVDPCDNSNDSGLGFDHHLEFQLAARSTVRFADQEVCRLTQWAHCCALLCWMSLHSETSLLLTTPNRYPVHISSWDFEILSIKNPQIWSETIAVLYFTVLLYWVMSDIEISNNELHDIRHKTSTWKAVWSMTHKGRWHKNYSNVCHLIVAWFELHCLLMEELFIVLWLPLTQWFSCELWSWTPTPKRLFILRYFMNSGFYL
jgi:hypothetical protein